MTRRIKSRINTALVLQGGGARGAYQIGVLKAVAEIEKVRRTPFSIISGASVGAINAAASSGDFQHGVHHLEKLWRGLHCNNIYHTHATAIAASSARWLCSIAFGGLGIGHPWALLDNTPLKHLLERETNWRHLHSSIRRGTLALPHPVMRPVRRLRGSWPAIASMNGNAPSG